MTYGRPHDKALEFMKWLKIGFEGCGDSEGKAREGKGSTSLCLGGVISMDMKIGTVAG